jgi:hypothetical protein
MMLLDLAAVVAREDRDAARRFVARPVEKIGAGMHVEPPIAGCLRPPVEPGDAAQVVDQVRAERRMNLHKRRQPRIHLGLHQRGMEMTGVDDDEAGFGHGDRATPSDYGKAMARFYRHR